VTALTDDLAAVEMAGRFCPSWCETPGLDHSHSAPEIPAAHVSTGLMHPVAGQVLLVRYIGSDVRTLVCLAGARRSCDDGEFEMTTGEARSLAAMLLYLADQQELNPDDN
jgi:hypothetical protein